LRAVDAIDSSVFVYEGRFEIPLAAALAHAQKASVFLASKRLPEALQEAQQAVALAPDSAGVNIRMGNVLDALGRREEARPYYATALQLGLTRQPAFQHSLIAPLKQRLAAKDDSATLGAAHAAK
jgi:Flp pilus assembly protein TadD